MMGPHEPGGDREQGPSVGRKMLFVGIIASLICGRVVVIIIGRPSGIMSGHLYVNLLPDYYWYCHPA